MALAALAGDETPITQARHSGHLPDFISAEVVPVDAQSDMTGQVLVYTTLREPEGSRLELREFQLLMRYVMDERSSYILVLQVLCGNPIGHPVVAGLGEIFKMTQLDTTDLYPPEYRVYTIIRRVQSATHALEFKSLRAFPAYKEVAQEGYSSAYQSAGRKELGNVLRKLDRYHLTGLRTQIAGDPTEVEIRNWTLQSNEPVYSARGGAYGHRPSSDNAYQRCSTCGFVRGGSCFGHILHTDFGSKLIPHTAIRGEESGIRLYVWAPTLSASYLGSPLSWKERKFRKTYESVVVRMFNWVKFARDVYASKNRAVFPLLQPHDMPSQVLGRPPSHLFRIIQAAEAVKKIKVASRAVEPVVWDNVQKSPNHGKYIQPSGEAAKVQRALIIRTSHPNSPLIVTATMFHAIIGAFKRAHPFYLDKIGFPVDKMVLSYAVIAPPEELALDLFEYYTKTSLGPPLEALHVATDIGKIPTLFNRLVTGDNSYASIAGSKEGTIVGSSKIVLAAASRLTFVIQPGNQRTIGIPWTLRHAVTEIYTSQARYEALRALGFITSVTDTQGVRHRSEKIQLYRIKPYTAGVATRRKVHKKINGASRFRVEMVEFPSVVVGLPLTVYVPPNLNGGAVSEFTRLPEDGDEVLHTRNPSLDTGAVKVSPARVDHVAITAQKSTVDADGQRADFDGDEGAHIIHPDYEARRDMYETMSTAAQMTFSDQTGVYGPNMIQDPLIAFYVLTKFAAEGTNVYFTVPPSLLTKSPYRVIDSYRGHTQFAIDLEKFTTHIPYGGVSYEDHVRATEAPVPTPAVDQNVDAPPLMYVSAPDIVRMLFPRNMPAIPGLIDLDTYEVVTRALTKSDIKAARGNILHHIYKNCDGEPEHVIDCVSWMQWILCEMLTYNTGMAWLSPYDQVPEYVPPIDIKPAYLEVVDDPNVSEATKYQIDWHYRLLSAPDDAPTSYRYAIQFLRRLAFLRDRDSVPLDERLAFYARIIEESNVANTTPSNAILTMAVSGARGDSAGTERLTNGFGGFTSIHDPIKTPATNPTAEHNFRTNPTDSASAALSGVLFSPLALGLPLEETVMLASLAIAALLQTPMTTTVTGVRAKYILSMYDGFHIKNGRAYSPGAIMGKV